MKYTVARAGSADRVLKTRAMSGGRLRTVVPVAAR
jgi:hypothetical protein